jgi:hypothetical protein
MGFLYGNLFNLQKFLWDISAVFHVYLFILKKPFDSPMFVSRCKKNYFTYVVGYGARICGFYIVYTIILFFGFPILFGLPVTINMDIVIRFLNLFSFLLSVYLCYIFLLIKTNKQMLSLLAMFCINLIVLLLYNVIGGIDNELSIKLGDLLIGSYFVLAIIMLPLIAFTVKRKDWLDSEK